LPQYKKYDNFKFAFVPILQKLEQGSGLFSGEKTKQSAQFEYVSNLIKPLIGDLN